MNKKKAIRWAAAALAVWVLSTPICAEGPRKEPAYSAVKEDVWQYDQFETAAKGCIVIEAETGRILYGQNIHTQLPMASTTKIMSALIALEQPNLDEYFTVDSQAIQVEGSSMGLQVGDQASLRMLVYGMILPSGNDSANATAVRIAGSIEGFVEMMNAKAEEMGLSNTHFVTPSGLDADGHYSTAYDMAMLTAAAMENPTFREICKLSQAQVKFGNPPYERWIKNHNKLMSMYEPCIGVKTGFTDNARRCLVSAAEQDGTTLICITLNAADDWNLHIGMYQRYFNEIKGYDLQQLLEEESIPVAGGRVRRCGVALPKPMQFPMKSGEKEAVSCQLLWDPFLFAPVKTGDLVGEAVFLYNGAEFARCPLVATGNVPCQEKENKSLIDRVSEFVLQLF